MSVVKPEAVTDRSPEKSLLSSYKKKAGRSHGKISVRHQGGGHKRRYRMVDFRQNKFDIPGVIKSIEKDPNRSALIALVAYVDGEKRYILATEKMRVGQTVVSGENAPIQEGSRLPLKNIPPGTIICNIESNLAAAVLARIPGATVNFFLVVPVATIFTPSLRAFLPTTLRSTIRATVTVSPSSKALSKELSGTVCFCGLTAFLPRTFFNRSTNVERPPSKRGSIEAPERAF